MNVVLVEDDERIGDNRRHGRRVVKVLFPRDCE
jgi:hypothetical protein